MAIEGLPPIVKPFVPAKTYDSRWLPRFSMDVPSLTVGSASIQAVGFISETNEIQPGPANEFVNIKNVWKAVAKVPKCALFMKAYLAMYPDLKAYADAGEPDVWPPVNP